MPQISHLNYHKGVTLSLSLSLPRCVSTLLPPSKYLTYFTTLSLWEFFSVKPKVQDLISGHWPGG